MLKQNEFKIISVKKRKWYTQIYSYQNYTINIKFDNKILKFNDYIDDKQIDYLNSVVIGINIFLDKYCINLNDFKKLEGKCFNKDKLYDENLKIIDLERL